MIRSSASLMAEDVTIRCRIRRVSTIIDVSSNINKNSLSKTRQRSLDGSIRREDDDGHEMICTVRNWECSTSRSTGRKWDANNRQIYTYGMGHSRSNHSNNSHCPSSQPAEEPLKMHDKGHRLESHGPELVLIPIEQNILQRDDSPLRRTRNHPRSTTSSGGRLSNGSSNFRTPMAVHQRPMEQCSIELSDIVVAYTFLSHKQPHRIHLSTFRSGTFEFLNLTDNALDILLAFLQAFVAPDRIICKSLATTNLDVSMDPGEVSTSKHGRKHVIPSNSSISSCIDIETLQAQHLRGSVASETWPEKFTRRMGHVVNSLSELCDSALCCSSTHEVDKGLHTLRSSAAHDQRDSPPSSNLDIQSNKCTNNAAPTVRFSHPMPRAPPTPTARYLEIDDSITECTNNSPSKKDKPRSFIRNSNVLSKANDDLTHQQAARYRHQGSASKSIQSDLPHSQFPSADSSLGLLPSGLSVEPPEELDVFETNYHDR